MKTKETTISGLRLNFIKQCDECGRVFDLLKPTDAEEWECGHDCECAANIRAHSASEASKLLDDDGMLDDKFTQL